MPVGHTGAKAPTPWFVPQSPWPWFTGLTRKGHAGIGNPQAALSPGAERYGFNADVSLNVALNGSNASGSSPGPMPATVQNVLNLSAAQIASAPAFSKRAASEY